MKYIYAAVASTRAMVWIDHAPGQEEAEMKVAELLKLDSGAFYVIGDACEEKDAPKYGLDNEQHEWLLEIQA